MRRNIALRLQYDGTAYHGWQVQKTDITVAETLERALTKVCGEPIKVVGCGRTDAGVHAKRYCANFRTDCTIPIDRVPLAVNARLPADIAVVDAVTAPEDFNAIGSCIQKEYVYQIYNSRIRDAFLEHRVCFYPQPLDFERLARAGRAFEGTHDFAAVRSVGTETRTTVRTGTGAAPSGTVRSSPSPSVPTASCIIWCAPSSAPWSTRPTAKSSRRPSRHCWPRATGASRGRPCPRRGCISTACGTTAPSAI